MKILKFLILTFGLVAVQGMFAVQLPKTSYSDSYMLTGGDYDVSVYGSGSRITGNFFQLSDGEASEFSVCEGDGDGYTTGGDECSECCKSKFPVDSESDTEGLNKRAACISYCNQGPPLPLDAPLWFMLALAALGAAFSVTMRKKLA